MALIHHDRAHAVGKGTYSSQQFVRVGYPPKQDKICQTHLCQTANKDRNAVWLGCVMRCSCCSILICNINMMGKAKVHIIEKNQRLLPTAAAEANEQGHIWWIWAWRPLNSEMLWCGCSRLAVSWHSDLQHPARSNFIHDQSWYSDQETEKITATVYCYMSLYNVNWHLCDFYDPLGFLNPQKTNNRYFWYPSTSN